MPDKSFKLEIVTTTKVVFTGDVMSFSAPGVIGGFQVLYNHAPLLAAIGVGEVKLLDRDGHEIRFATGGGFVDVVQNHVTMLAESAERAEEIDTKRAEEARERASRRLSERIPGTDLERARVALARALNRIRIARGG
jgi:F-type H+-transporting ATPase subunit epsilon